jgi:hypothetical protein
VLLLIAFLEVAIERIAVPMLRPATGTPPTWHEMLDYAGLFLHYFAATLAAGVLIMQAVSALGNRRGVRDAIAQVAVLVAAVLAALPLAISELGEHSLPLEIAFAIAVVAIVVAVFARERDLGIQIGAAVVAVPLLLHTIGAIGNRFLWPEGAFDAPATTITHAGVMALCIAALVSPYVFAPRPFARAVTRPGPVVFAMAIAAFGAVAARTWYPQIAHAAMLGIGVELNQGQADPRLALYLLAIATLAWTLASCAIAAAPARRQVGMGIALVVLGGYAFHWPHHYLLPLLGLALIGDAARRIREEELAALPISTDTPPIQDAAWSAYIAMVKTGLAKLLGTDIHTLTTRGDGGLTTSLIVGEHAGLPVRTRIERIEGSVIALDVVVGREIDELRGATLCLWGIPPRALGVNPNGPPAAPTFKSGDAMFDARFKCRGSALAFTTLFDDKLRARSAATLDGWVAYWEREGLRYRVYPGRGAPLDHPLPLSDLALGRPGTADRLVAVIELLVEIAAHGVEAQVDTAPSSLEMEPAS